MAVFGGGSSSRSGGAIDPGWGSTPDHVTISNVATGVTMEVPINPTQLTETYGITYARQTVVGLGFQVLQYINTNNPTFDVTLPFVARGGGPAELKKILDCRIFLIHVVYPIEANDVLGGGAPRVLFVWPTIISLTCIITELKFDYTEFNLRGTPIAFTATMKLEEIRDVNILSNDIVFHGTRRSPGRRAGS